MACETGIVSVIDPDESVHDALTALLGINGTRVVCYANAEAFLDSGIAHGSTQGVLLVEASLPGMGSLALLRRLRQLSVDLPVVVLTSTSNREISDQALRAGAVEVIQKPLVADRLLELLRTLATDTSSFVIHPNRE